MFVRPLSLPEHSPGAAQSDRGFHAASVFLGDGSVGHADAFDLYLSAGGHHVHGGNGFSLGARQRVDHGTRSCRMSPVAGVMSASRRAEEPMPVRSQTVVLRGLLLALACVAFPASGWAQADAVAEFYRRKTITILIGFPVGGTYDTYARLAATHLGRFIPGQPSIVVQSRIGGS